MPPRALTRTATWPRDGVPNLHRARGRSCSRHRALRPARRQPADDDRYGEEARHACTAGDIDPFDAANAEEMFPPDIPASCQKSPTARPSAMLIGPITKKLIDAYSKDVGCDFVGQYLKFLN
jgi:hypothetical protein